MTTAEKEPPITRNKDYRESEHVNWDVAVALFRRTAGRGLLR